MKRVEENLGTIGASKVFFLVQSFSVYCFHFIGSSVKYYLISVFNYNICLHAPHPNLNFTIWSGSVGAQLCHGATEYMQSPLPQPASCRWGMHFPFSFLLCFILELKGNRRKFQIEILVSLTFFLSFIVNEKQAESFHL